MVSRILGTTALCGLLAATVSAGGHTSTDEVRALVAEMLADAETRSSLLQGGATSGHDGRFFLASSDGDFRLNIGGQIQFRYTATFRDSEGGMRDDFDGGFATSRTTLRFDGAAYDNFIFGVEGVFDRQGGTDRLEDAYVGYAMDNGLVLIWGQYREPILWEQSLNDRYSLAVDQSVVSAVFGQGFSQGAWLHYSADDWRFWAGFNDGIRSANTDLTADPADWGVTTRWEYKLAGDWSQFDSFSSARGSAFAMKLGGGAHFEQSPNVPGPVPETDLLAYTADLMLKGDGWNAFLMGVGLYTDTNAGVGSFADWGFMAQGGVFLTDDFEPFIRYDVVIPDGDRANSKSFNTLAVGANYYLHGHAAKFTFDVQWFFNDTVGNDLVSGVATGAPGSIGNRIGLLPSGDDKQFALRAQFQLLF